MAKVEVIVEGSALWVPRRDSWSVLFPKAMGGNPQHTPYLSYTVDDSAEGPATSIRNKFVRVVGVRNHQPKPQKPYWLQLLSGAPGSDARKQPSDTRPTVISELRLPRHVLLPEAAVLIGPIEDPRTNTTNHYWSYGSKIEFEVTNEQAKVLTASLSTSDEIETSQPLHSTFRRITMRVRNMTVRELQGDSEPTKQNEVLYEMKDLFAVVGDPDRDPPIYRGDDLKQVPEIEVAGEALRAFVSIYRLCPQGYCDDCPDD